jgi:hypothetical protein
VDFGTVLGLCPCLDLRYSGARGGEVSCVLGIKEDGEKSCTAFIWDVNLESDMVKSSFIITRGRGSIAKLLRCE